MATINPHPFNPIFDSTTFTPNQLVWMANGLSTRMNTIPFGESEWIELDTAFHEIAAAIEHLMGRDWLIANLSHVGRSNDRPTKL